MASTGVNGLIKGNQKAQCKEITHLLLHQNHEPLKIHQNHDCATQDKVYRYATLKEQGCNVFRHYFHQLHRIGIMPCSKLLIGTRLGLNPLNVHSSATIYIYILLLSIPHKL